MDDDLRVRLNIIAELRGAFRTAIELLDVTADRLRAAREGDEQERIGAELEGFLRRLGLAALAFGNPGNVKGDKP